ncbi:band 4.1-like protein 2 [Silurus asotus]|uniref:Band 4.1-like protein 2 n=1 Tax=Silurus asotus TaxID=30991 RepID=A0AAD5F9J8_SILAS|nr:band 4.1-like protein 2 [Silurus asotus]
MTTVCELLQTVTDTNHRYYSSFQTCDLDKTQEDVLRHQASISELKRSFMEAAPEPRPSQWEKRLTGSPVAASVPLPVAGINPAHLESALSDSADISKNEQNSGINGQPEVIEVVEEIIVFEEVKANKPKSPDPERQSTAVIAVSEKAKQEEAAPENSGTSESESEEEAEYHAQLPASPDSTHLITEEPENEKEQQVEPKQEVMPTEAEPQPVSECVEEEESPPPNEPEASIDEVVVTPNETPNGHSDGPEAPSPPAEDQEEEPRVVNGDSSHTETERVPQPPVVKTEMVTISDTFAAQKTEITTKEEAKEQHPDMSVTRVVVHKETELAEDDE